MHDLTTSHERALTKWLAKAAPVKVTRLNLAKAKQGMYNGVYHLDSDEIEILAPADWYRLHIDDAPWAVVLAHEVVHSTQFRTKRESIASLQHAFNVHPMVAWLLKRKEEAVAYYAAALIADKFGLDSSVPMARFEHELVSVPRSLFDMVAKQAHEAVDWLTAHAETVDKRPFDDDLARWAKE